LRRPIGLYAITLDSEGDIFRLRAQVGAAISGGARIIQYRDKSVDHRHRRQAANVLRGLCRSTDTALIINDDVELAAEVGADGVHIGCEDAPLRAARAQLGPRSIIGVSCYNELHLALAAQSGGADYVAFGSFFTSPTKPSTVQAAPELLHRARPQITLPIVAIGGITPENGGTLIAAGADMLAAISGVFGQPDIAAAARAYSRLFPEDSAT
jgi:thiamine-phosphate pyrophosphorylase